MSDKVVLAKGINVVESLDLSAWTEQKESAIAQQRIKNEAIGDATVLTELLGLARHRGSSPMLCFEATVLGKATDQDHWNSSISRDELVIVARTGTRVQF